MNDEFSAIRPYNDDEVRPAIESLLRDRQFSRLLKGVAPFLPLGMSRGMLRLATVGIHSTLQFQLRFMKPVVNYILRKCSTGHTFQHDTIKAGDERYTFISNHRDIVLDSAILDLMLADAKFPTTCEIAIGDNLLIYPWIRTLVRLNKAFVVRRNVGRHELYESSLLLSHYMHHAIQEKRENIWIAQREGRAKDSSDQTQVSLLKMFALTSDTEDTEKTEGTEKILEHLKSLNIVPLSISYEYDPCDYLKAREFQQRRDDPAWKKTKQDDLTNMKTGILGQKGHVHYHAAPCINTWIDELDGLPEKDFYPELARRIDHEIHRHYRLFPSNYAAADLLSGRPTHAERYTHRELVAFEQYIKSRIALVDLPDRDDDFLRERLLTMYANPVLNYEKAR